MILDRFYIFLMIYSYVFRRLFLVVVVVVVLVVVVIVVFAVVVIIKINGNNMYSCEMDVAFSVNVFIFLRNIFLSKSIIGLIIYNFLWG